MLFIFSSLVSTRITYSVVPNVVEVVSDSWDLEFFLDKGGGGGIILIIYQLVGIVALSNPILVVVWHFFRVVRDRVVGLIVGCCLGF